MKAPQSNRAVSRSSTLTQKITIPLRHVLAIVAAVLLQPAPLVAADLVLIGNHPTSILTSLPTIHTLKAHEGRIYCGYGEWFGLNYPAVVVASYDPGAHAFRLEFSAQTDSIGIFREIGGTLYMPSIDPVLYDNPRDYSFRSGGVWRDYSPANMLHVLDMGTMNGTDLWLVGSKSINETTNHAHAVFRSIDAGRTWQDLTLQSTRTDDRYYWGFCLRGKFYVVDTVYDGTNAIRAEVSPYRHVNKATVMGSGSNEFVVGVTGWVKGTGAPLMRPLVSYDTQSWRTLRNNVYDFTVVGSNVFTLETNSPLNAIWMASNVTPAGALWQSLNFGNIPSNAKCIEVLDGVVYVGDAQGRLWACRLDGNALATNQVTVINEMTDDFGRALSFDGDLLAIGAPDHSGAAPLCGRVTLWQPTNSAGSAEAWSRVATIEPAQGSFGGGFGKHLALKENLLAIIEAGRDTSLHDRGSSAQIHLYQRSNDQWTAHSALTHAYAQTVAIDSGWLAVGTGGIDYDTNYLHLYKFANNSNALAITLSTNIQVRAPGNFWRPSARVVLEQDLCVFATVGDAGFSGGPGEVRIYQRDEADAWHLRQTLHSTAPVPAHLSLPPDRFGLALALANDWLAIGAPCDDTAALQAGAVYLYQRTNSPGGIVSFVLRQTLYSPFPQQEAAFGSSLAMNGSTLLIGCPGAEKNTQRHHGAVFVFRWEQNAWQQVAEITRPGKSTGEFGNFVALESNWLAASSRFTGGSTNVADRITLWPIGPLGGELFAKGKTEAGGFELTARGEIGRTYRLQAATDLSVPTWSNLFSFRLTIPATNLVDSVSNAPQRMYRLDTDAETP